MAGSFLNVLSAEVAVCFFGEILMRLVFMGTLMKPAFCMAAFLIERLYETCLSYGENLSKLFFLWRGTDETYLSYEGL